MSLKIQSVSYPIDNYNTLSEGDKIKLFGGGILSSRDKIRRELRKQNQKLIRRFKNY